MKKEAQASIEVMVILVIAISILAVILTVDDRVISGIDGSYNARKANLLLDSLVQAGDLVYSQGNGAKSKIFVNIPVGVHSITLSGRVINLTLNISGAQTTMYRKTNFQINGTIPTGAGNYWLMIRSNDRLVNVSWLNTS